MGNCLVTKLKESVNNSALPCLGEIKIQYPLAGATITISPVNACSYRTDGEFQYSFEAQPQYNWDLIQPTVAGILFIKDDYNKMTRIHSQAPCIADLNQFKYRSSLERIVISDIMEETTVDAIGIYNANQSLTQLILSYPQPTSDLYNRNVESTSHGLDLATSRLTHIACNMNCVWSSRSSSQNKLARVQGINFGDDLDKFLIDMAACQGTSDRIYVYGTLTGSPEETAAINTLKSATTEFFINEVKQKV